MGGSSKKTTVGYRRFAGVLLLICHSVVDKLLKIRVNEKTAWVGEQTGAGRITVNQPALFGGESAEGGIVSDIDFLTGEPTQGQNDYLQRVITTNIPAWRGVASAVLRHAYFGTNPYLKKWDFLVSRVHTRANGQPQWYGEKAEINNVVVPSPEIEEQFSPTSDGWKYLQVAFSDTTDYSSPDFDDSSWSEGQFPFGDAINHPTIGSFPNVINTTWQVNTKLWVRRNFTVNDPTKNIRLEVLADNWATVWVNGVMVLPRSGSDLDTTTFLHVIEIPSGYIKESNTIAILAEDIEQVTFGNRTNLSIRPYVQVTPQYDMNAAHILRECITESWGMNYPEEDVDDPFFVTAADTLYDEQFGLSLLWDKPMPIEDFVKEVLRHIDGTLYVDRTTGKFVLKLIRPDYVYEDLPVFDKNNIIRIENFKETAFSEPLNSITVDYWNYRTLDTASITLSNPALVQMHGSVISTTVQYPGITNSINASKVAARDLKTLSNPVNSFVAYVNQDGMQLNIGDAIRVIFEEHGVKDSVYRVSDIGLGDGKNNQIRLSLSEDVYTFPSAPLVANSGEIEEDLPPQNLSASRQKAFEVPYFELVQNLGQTTVDTTLERYPLVGYAGIAAARPQIGEALYSVLYTNAGAGFEEIGALDFSPSGVLAEPVGRFDTTLQLTQTTDIDLVPLGTWAQIGSELVGIISINEDGSAVVERGVLDTVPAPHSAGELLLFSDAYGKSDEVEYLSGEEIKLKLVVLTDSSQSDIDTAVEQSVVIEGRAARPYPPGNFSISATALPDYIIGESSFSWAHRDRTAQTGGDLIGYTEGSIGPETGTTYSIELYGETGTLDKQYDGLTGVAQTWDTETADSGTYRSNGQVSLYEPFYTSLPDGLAAFYSAGGTPADEFHPSTGGVRLIAGNFLTYWRLDSQPDLYSGEFEIDIEPYTDCGLWLAGADGTGYRFAYDGAWSALRYNNYTETVSLGTAITSPVITSSVRYKFKVVWDADTGKMQFYVDGVKVFDVTDKTYKRLRPAVYLFGGDVIVHEVRLLARRTIDRLNNRITVKAYSVVDGRSSWQPVDFETTRVGYGYSYGIYYGSL